MEKCHFSETQFSFCFTFEYIKQFFPNIPLPIFPNIREEGRIGGGYNVQINGNIYFQFKIPVFYDKVINFNRKHWNVFGHEYYKIKLETDQNQYKFLKDLQGSRNKVYYATPEFHLSCDLNSFYTSDNIVQNSAVFSLNDLPNYNSGYHNLVYSPSHDFGKLFSEPMEIKKVKSINPDELFYEGKNDLTIYDQARKILKIIQNNKDGLTDAYYIDDNKPQQFIKAIHSILLTEYNIHWYPVISRRDQRYW